MNFIGSINYNIWHKPWVFKLQMVFAKTFLWIEFILFFYIIFDMGPIDN